MISVPSLLIDTSQKPATAAATKQEDNKRSSVLDISSLLCSTSITDNDNTYNKEDQRDKASTTYHNDTPAYNTHHCTRLPSIHQQREHPLYHHSQKHNFPKHENKDYTTMLWARHQSLQQLRYCHQNDNKEHERITYKNRITPSSSIIHHGHHFDNLISDSQRRSPRQHLIQSRKIEKELLQHDRRKSSWSFSSHSSIHSHSSSTTGTNKYNNAAGDYSGEEEGDDNVIIPSTIKAKRRRASTKQLDVLNKVFERTIFPSTQFRNELGRQLGMSPRTVQIWFQNKRQALRSKERSPSSSPSSGNGSRSSGEFY